MAIKRRQYIVKPGLQLRYLIILGTIIFVAAILIYYSFLKSLLSSPGMDQLSAGAVQNFIRVYTGGFFWVTISFIVIVLILSIFYFHRLVGPIFFFEKITCKMAEGDFSVKVHHRKKDETITLAKNLDRVVTNVKNAVVEDREKISAAQEALEAGNTSKVKEILSHLTQWFKI